MDNEVTKLYENAEIKKINTHQSEIDNGDPRFTGISQSNSFIKYPPFTAEKQLNLMAFLINRKVGLSFKAEQGEITVEAISRGLAGIVNRIWQDLTDTEKEQIKEILK